jgi:hypothetical protein
MRIRTTLLLALVLAIACKKSNNKQDRLHGAWKLTALTADVPYDWNNDGVMETDLYSVFTTCEKDNLLTINDGGTGKGKGYCTDQQRDIQWYSNNLITYLEVWDSFFAGKYEVVSISRSTLVMKKRLFLSNDYHTYTFTKM